MNSFIQRQTRRAAGYALPAILQQRFNPAAAADLHTVYELRVRGPGETLEDRFALHVDDGTLLIERRPTPEAVAWVSVSLRDMVALIDNGASVWELMAARRLDIGGEPFTALRFPKLFRL